MKMKPKQLFFFGVVLLGICFVYACGKKSSIDPTQRWSCEVRVTLEYLGVAGYTIASGSGTVEVPDLNDIPAAFPSGSARGSGTFSTEALARSVAREKACSELELPAIPAFVDANVRRACNSGDSCKFSMPDLSAGGVRSLASARCLTAPSARNYIEGP